MGLHSVQSSRSVNLYLKPRQHTTKHCKMSFLYRSTPLLRTSATTLTSQSTRCFSTSLAQRNVVKDAAKKVDRTVSDQLVKGIDKGIEAKDAVAEVAGVDTQKAKAEELKGDAKAKGEQMKGQANAAKEEAKAKI